MSYIENPKTKGSGIICCIPHKSRCPNNCADCFFQSGKSYLEPLENNLPNIPPAELSIGRVIRVNDGHDSSINYEHVLSVCERFTDKFYNTSSLEGPDLLKWATVLTVNPGEFTDDYFFKSESPYLMMVRARINMWNLQLIENIIDFYALKRNISVILTWMNYPTIEQIPDDLHEFYTVKTHILNPYASPNEKAMGETAYLYSNPNVYECGTLCRNCGNCLREYYKWKEKLGC